MTKMAHEIETMMSVKQTPWHGLGVILPEAPTASEAIKHAGLDWTVSKRQVQFQQRIDGGFQTAKGQFAVVRDSDERYMGYAGETWQPLQNTEAFKFFDPFVQAGEASYETAGSLDNGKRIWVLAKINRDPIEIVKGDIIEKYILLSNQHRAGYAVRGALTPIRVVCANTEAMAFQSKRSQLFKATHSKKMEMNLERMQASIAAADQAFEQTAEYYRQFSRRNVTQNDLTNFINGVFGFADIVNKGREQVFKDKQHETIMRLFETGRGSDIKGVRGTVWGMYNTITEYTQHEAGKLEDKRLNSAWFGHGMDINIKAFNLAKELVSA